MNEKELNQFKGTNLKGWLIRVMLEVFFYIRGCCSIKACLYVF
jgi:hypothetical protein